MRKKQLRAAELVENHLTDDDICALLGINRKSLNNKICHGGNLPPYIKIQGGRRRLWPTEEVDRWLNTQWENA